MLRALAALLLLTLLSPLAGAVDSLPTSLFTRRPLTLAASVSADGKHLEYIASNEDLYSSLVVVDLATMESQSIKLDNLEIYKPVWLDENRLIFNVISERRYAKGLYSYEIGSKVAKGINEHEVTDIVSIRKDMKGRAYIWYRMTVRDNLAGLALIDVDRKRAAGPGRSKYRIEVDHWVKEPPGQALGYTADHQGIVRLAYSFHQGRLRVYEHGQDSEPWRELPLNTDTDTVFNFTFDGRGLYVAHRNDGDATEHLRVFNLDTGEFGPSLFNDPDFSLSTARLIYPEGMREPAGLVYYTDRATPFWFSDRFRNVQNEIDLKLPGTNNLIIDSDAAGTEFVIEAQSDRMPARHYLYRAASAKLVALPAPAPWIDPAKMRPMQSIRYRARDGLELSGYLTLPHRTEGSAPPPLVVFPHGGPQARDVWGWHSAVQFLASRGYAVFQPNYRGSVGFKHEATRQSYEFLKMHEDVTDGVKAIKLSGTIDPERIAIFGASFGGFLALTGTAFEPDLYRCAVSYAGVFDWKRMLRQLKFRAPNRPAYETLVEHLGDPSQNAASFEKISPIHHTGKIKVPVLLSHGLQDPVVDESQSRQLLRELERNGVDAEYLPLKDEGHGFADPINNEKFLDSMERFLRSHL